MTITANKDVVSYEQPGVLPNMTAHMVVAHPPYDMLTDGGFGPVRQLKVDVSQTGFLARRMFRLSYEFTALAGTPIVLKFVSPVNFIIHKQNLSVDDGGAALRVYREGMGTEGGTFGTTVTYYSMNFMDEEDEYTFQSTITTGGTFTATDPSVETLRVKTSGATAQTSTVTGDASDERGISAGTYYLILSRLTGVTADTKGVYTLNIEERP